MAIILWSLTEVKDLAQRQILRQVYPQFYIWLPDKDGQLAVITEVFSVHYPGTLRANTVERANLVILG
ncbi:MAG: hypothetical protein L6406_11590 [Desulfobacterales bacterium]|nr:hypothetical protein [Desulfobacterales bacterium]